MIGAGDGKIITSLQTVATRKFSVFDPVMITVGVATAGQALT